MQKLKIFGKAFIVLGGLIIFITSSSQVQAFINPFFFIFNVPFAHDVPDIVDALFALLFMAFTALALILTLVPRSTPRFLDDTADFLLPNLSTIFNKAAPSNRVIDLGRAPRERALVEYFSRFIPVAVSFFLCWSYDTSYLFSYGIIPSLITLTFMLCGAVVAFFSARFVVLACLDKNGPYVCWLLIFVSGWLTLQMIIGLASLRLDDVKVKTGADLLSVVVIYISLVIPLSPGMYAAAILHLRRYRLSGISLELDLVPRSLIPGKGIVRPFGNDWRSYMLLAGYGAGAALLGALVGVFFTFVIWIVFNSSRARKNWQRRRFLAKAGHTVFERDHRSNILLLRSFEDDAMTFDQATFTQDAPPWAQAARSQKVSGPARNLAPWASDARRYSFEEAIAYELWRYGPVVTIGRPDEALPDAGAVREYVEVGSWRMRVRELVASARCVVVVVAYSRGLQWEVEYLINNNHLSKCLFVFPPVSADVNLDRWRRLWGERITGIAELKMPNNVVAIFLAHWGDVVAISAKRPDWGPATYGVAMELGVSMVEGARALADQAVSQSDAVGVK